MGVGGGALGRVTESMRLWEGMGIGVDASSSSEAASSQELAMGCSSVNFLEEDGVRRREGREESSSGGVRGVGIWDGEDRRTLDIQGHCKMICLVLINGFVLRLGVMMPPLCYSSLVLYPVEALRDIYDTRRSIIG